MKLQDFMGLSGRIKFDTYGKRTDFQLNVLELTRTGLETIGNNTGIKKKYHSMFLDVMCVRDGNGVWGVWCVKNVYVI